MPIHDRAMTKPCGQTGPALRVDPQRPPCGSASLGKATSLAGATHSHLTTSAGQRGPLEDREQALRFGEPRMSQLHSFQPPERLLLGPGPSPVPPRILGALARPTIGHL